MPHNTQNERIYFYRQVFILLTIFTQSLATGVMMAFPSILNPAILEPHSTNIRATSSQASWLTSIFGYIGLPGFFVLSFVMQKFGRKVIHIFKNSLATIGWVIFIFSRSLKSLFIARCFQGFNMAGIFINVMIIGEYVDPDRRGYFTVVQKIGLSIGALFCHSVALWLTWRQVAAIALVPSLLSILMTFFWPESPFFLAMKGRYDECERSFHWLNGTVTRNKELMDMIAAQKEIKRNQTEQQRIRRLWKILVRRDFVRAFSIVAVLSITIDLCGRNYFKAYILQIMTDLTGSKTSGVYISLVSDSLVILALLSSSFTIRSYKRRAVLFFGGVLSVLVLFAISLVLFLKNNVYSSISTWVSPCLILLMNAVVHMSVGPVSFAIISEIFPLNLKGVGSCLSGLVLTASYGTILKLTPVFMEHIGLEGAYVIYGSMLAGCLVILYFILPETKDKTLLEIEIKLKGEKDSIAVKGMTLLEVT